MAWRYTTDHAASSYGQPVLVNDETGIAYGPGDKLATSEVASFLEIDESHVRRLARDHGFGEKRSERVALMTVAESEAIRALLKPGRGRPKKES